MAFPIINFKITNAEVPIELQDLCEEKLRTLEKHIGDESDTTCEVEFEKVAPHQNGDIYRVETNLLVHGKLYRAEATETNFEMAIDEVRNELDKELRRSNDKRWTRIKKGGRKLKEMMRFGQ